MGTERADAVIVGAGLAGSAAARALASRGRSVVLARGVPARAPARQLARQRPDLPAGLPGPALRAADRRRPRCCGGS